MKILTGREQKGKSAWVKEVGAPAIMLTTLNLNKGCRTRIKNIHPPPPSPQSLILQDEWAQTAAECLF